MPWISVYMPKSAEQVIKRFKKLAKREGRSQSRIIREMMVAYLIQHEHGNPQKPLVPTEVLPPPEYSRNPVVRRKQVQDDLLATVERNEGCDMMTLANAFGAKAGMRTKTVLEYIRQLLSARLLRKQGSKLFVR